MLRRRHEPERGLCIAESQKVIRRALRAGHRPRSYLMACRWLDDLSDIVADAEADGIPVYFGDHDVIEQLTGFHLHRGALAAMQRPALPTVESLIADARRVIVLEDVVDHTNVGAIFRSAAALGVDAVLITPRCADPLYRRSIRVSMGTVFQVRWTRIDPWPQGIGLLHDAGLTVAAMALSDDSVRSTTSRALHPSGSPPSGHRGRRTVAPDGRRRRPHPAHPDGRWCGLAQRRRRECRRHVGPAPTARA